MSRPPNTRRAKDNRPPVTIDLKPDASPKDAAAPVDAPVPPAEPVAFDQLDARGAGGTASGAAAQAADVAAARVEQAVSNPSTTAPDQAPADAKPFAASPSARPAPSVATAPAPRRGGLSTIAAGLIGGVAALAIAGALQWMGLLGVPGSSSQPAFDPAPLRAEIETLRQQVAAAQPGGVPDATVAEIAAAREAAAQATSVSDTAARGLADLTARVDSLAQEAEALKSSLSSGAGGEAPALAALSQRADALEEQLRSLSTAAGGANTAELQALTDRLAALEQAPPATQALEQDVGALRQAVEPLTALPARIDEVQAAVDTVTTQVGELRTQVEGSASGEQIARAIAASGLNAAINRGGPFMTELEAFATVAPDAPEVETLKAYAAAGVPTLAALSDRFAAVANDIIASEPAAEGAGVFDRLMNSAQSLVKVRPVGEVEGDTPGAIAARMEVALKRGDIAAALAEWEKLPGHAKEASSAFAADLRARRDVDQLAEKALKGAMAANGQG